MKNNLFVMVIMCLLFFAPGVNATTLSTDEFQITPLEKTSVEMATKAWSLKYNDKQDMLLTIEKIPTKKGIEYVVYSDYFEISYVCCKRGFGVRNVKPAWSKVDPRRTEKVLAPSKMSNQRVISPNQVSEENALELIASYLPDLLKDEYKYLLN